MYKIHYWVSSYVPKTGVNRALAWTGVLFMVYSCNPTQDKVGFVYKWMNEWKYE